MHLIEDWHKLSTPDYNPLLSVWTDHVVVSLLFQDLESFLPLSQLIRFNFMPVLILTLVQHFLFAI